MNRQTWIGVTLVALLAAGRTCGEQPSVAPAPESGCAATAPDGAPDHMLAWLRQVAPASGWDPYGGGLLHWWPRDCFPRCGAPDDYCRKPLPCACWPAYPPYYIWAPPEICHPQDSCRPANGKPQ